MKDMRLRQIVLIAVFAVFVVSGAVFKTEAAVDPIIVELHYQNGVKYYKRGLYDKALSEFEKTLSLDPSHEEAKDYVEKIAKMDEKQKRVEAKKSENEQLKELYKKGKELYAQHDFEGAQAVFQQILKIKPVDDFASFYRERCEIFISRKLAREKKIEDRKKLKEKKIQEKEERIKKKERDLERKRELAAERARIKEEHKQAVKDRKSAQAQKKTGEPAVVKESPEIDTAQSSVAKEAVKDAAVSSQEPTKKEMEAARRKQTKEEKVAAAEQRREERIAQAKQRREEKRAAAVKAKEEKRAQREKMRQEKEQARQAKILAAEEKKQARLAEIEAKKEAARQKKAQKSNVAPPEDREKKNNLTLKKAPPAVKSSVLHEEGKSVKQLYLEGAEQLGRKQYTQAVESFLAVIEQEKNGPKLYTNAAKRLIEKAQMRLNEGASKKVQ